MKFVILPMQPTPNGRMHIGHGGGTYLRADVLARSLRAEGHDVKVACGTDAYENWVLAAAQLDGREPLESCEHYHDGIGRDLIALDIDFDVWINPLSSEHKAAYIQLHQEYFHQVKGQALYLKEERVPYATDDGSPLMGTFIAGDCPNCGAGAGGSSCTNCSEHFQPEQLRNPRARLSDSPIEWRDERNWFIKPTSAAHLLARLAHSGTASSNVDVASRFVARTGGEIRVSGPGRWGVPFTDLPEGHVLANSYFLYCLYAAQCVVPADEPNPFNSASHAITVGVFGTDNSTPGLVVPGVYSQATNGMIGPFDHTVVNGMLDLDGQKCSTSKRYGIWLGEALGSDLVTSSELRYALSGVDLDTGRANLELVELAAEVTRLRALIHSKVAAIMALRPSLEEAEGDRSLIREQRRSLQPGHLRLTEAKAVLDWHLASDPQQSAGWLATFCALAEPFMPALVRTVREGAPTDSAVHRGALLPESLDAIVHRGISQAVMAGEGQ